MSIVLDCIERMRKRRRSPTLRSFTCGATLEVMDGHLPACPSAEELEERARELEAEALQLYAVSEGSEVLEIAARGKKFLSEQVRTVASSMWEENT